MKFNQSKRYIGHGKHVKSSQVSSSSSSPFQSLSSKICKDDSDDAWVIVLREFCSANAAISPFGAEGKASFLLLLKSRISLKCSSLLDTNLELLLLLCDCVRISFRDKSETEALITEDFIADLLLIVECKIFPYLFNGNGTTAIDVSEIGLRCLMNVMNDNKAATDLFLSQTINGMHRVLALLQCWGSSNKDPTAKYHATRLLYMLLSQRSEIIGVLLQNKKVQDIFLLQLGLCVSLSHYDILKKNDASVESTKTTGETDGSILASSAIKVDIDDPCLEEKSGEKGSGSYFSDTAQLVVDDNVIYGDSTNTIIDLGDTRKVVTAARLVGEVREGWGMLFVESCKLLYALYGQSDSNSNSDNMLNTSVNITALCELLCDVILAPIQPCENANDSSSNDNMQMSCRRHAIQLAMLSLDINPITQPSDLSKRGNAGTVPLLLQILQSKGGVKVLCEMLQDFFLLMEAAALKGESFQTSVGGLSPAVVIAPILVVLSRVATSCQQGRTELKGIVFPNPWRSNVEQEREEEVGTGDLQERMDPVDVPAGSLRCRLIGLMTSLDTVLKRYCAELLYVLCDQDSSEFVTRTGFGNAVALMQIKGLL